MGAVVVATGAFACLQWLRAPTGVLRWDGQGWWWQPSGGGSERAGVPALRLDLQRRLLLRWRTDQDGAVLWLWLDAGSVDGKAAWHVLRCALHARLPRVPAGPAGDRRARDPAAGTSA